MKRKFGFLSSLFKPKSLGVKILFAVALFLVIYLLYNRVTEEFSLLTKAAKAVRDETENEDALQKAAEAEKESSDTSEWKEAAQSAPAVQNAAEAKKAAAAKRVAQAQRALAAAKNAAAAAREASQRASAAQKTLSVAISDGKTVGGQIGKKFTSNLKKLFS